MGASELREIYLKTDNYIGGDYFARLIKVESTRVLGLWSCGVGFWLEIGVIVRFGVVELG